MELNRVDEIEIKLSNTATKFEIDTFRRIIEKCLDDNNMIFNEKELSLLKQFDNFLNAHP